MFSFAFNCLGKKLFFPKCISIQEIFLSCHLEIKHKRSKIKPLNLLNCKMWKFWTLGPDCFLSIFDSLFKNNIYLQTKGNVRFFWSNVNAIKSYTLSWS